ncbi:MAG: putative lipoprotein YmbA [Cellvibrionaceae bacterium]|jgi:uncharacterized lipoprotein YmbA
MNTYFTKVFSTIFLIVIVVVSIACSRVPTTRYYTLVSDDSIPNASDNNSDDSGFSIGIGPLVIPNSLENFSVISIENNNNMIINLYYLWAGNLKSNINQVVADNISRALNIDSVWAFPWDNRNRPKIQIRIVFEQFMGELGKSVTVQAKWTMLADYGKKEIKTEKTVITESLSSSDYLSYVQALNIALNKLSLIIAAKLSELNA